MSEQKNEIGFTKIENGEYEGVFFKINSIEYVQEGGANLLKFTYDVRNLDEKYSAEFEAFLLDRIKNDFKRAKLECDELGF